MAGARADRVGQTVGEQLAGEGPLDRLVARTAGPERDMDSVGICDVVAQAGQDGQGAAAGHHEPQGGLGSRGAGGGELLNGARSTAAQVRKFDRRTAIAAKQFIKPIPYEELQQEIDIFCELSTQPAVEAGLKKFVESKDAQPYLP